MRNVIWDLWDGDLRVGMKLGWGLRESGMGLRPSYKVEIEIVRGQSGTAERHFSMQVAYCSGSRSVHIN